jgi:hypothetical protein
MDRVLQAHNADAEKGDEKASGDRGYNNNRELDIYGDKFGLQAVRRMVTAERPTCMALRTTVQMAKTVTIGARVCFRKEPY